MRRVCGHGLQEVVMTTSPCNVLPTPGTFGLNVGPNVPGVRKLVTILAGKARIKDCPAAKYFAGAPPVPRTARRLSFQKKPSIIASLFTGLLYATAHRRRALAVLDPAALCLALPRPSLPALSSGPPSAPASSKTCRSSSPSSSTSAMRSPDYSACAKRETHPALPP
jgi:hypothetical protein